MINRQTPIIKPHNFRDLGGIPCQNGMSVINGRLLRCGQVRELSEEDAKLLLDTYDITKIIDFRSSKETLEEPDDTLENAEYIHIDIFRGLTENAPNQNLMSQMDSPDKVDAFMIHTYGLMVTNQTSLEGYQKFMQLLLEQKDSTTIFHCQAGKDRTGVAAAIILSILGASRDDIMDDYLLTNEMRKEANLELIDKIEKQGAPKNILPALKVALQVKADYLLYGFSMIDEYYGSLDSFIEKGLQMTPEMTDTFRSMYLH